MTPFYADDWLTVYGGDCREVLASLPSDSVDCVVTSPPYWGLRDYGNDGQLGLERTPEEYVANMVAVFREVRRVLKPSGTCWLNLGDSYAANWSSRRDEGGGGFKTNGRERTKYPPAGLKSKDLVGIPWRVAFALQADGWYLRSDVIWSKPNPMPESVTDRPTKSHEYLFLLTKGARYYFDADAVREAHTWVDDRPRMAYNGKGNPEGRRLSGDAARLGNSPAGRNIRSVWTIATRPYPGAHFAVFPPELPERCIKAGSSERGVCPECGAPWERVVEREPGFESRRQTEGGLDRRRTGASTNGYRGVGITRQETTGWRPSCGCNTATPLPHPSTQPCSMEGCALWLDHAGEHTSQPYYVTSRPIPAVILDPFAGSGTVGMVANRLSRRAILIDLNPEYLKQQMARNAQTPLGLGAA
jgi:DNA modification methylase